LETFSGAIDVAGVGPVHQFAIQQSNGLLNLVLTSVTNTATSAPAGVAMGIALGSQSSSGCVADQRSPSHGDGRLHVHYIRIVGDGERGQLLLHRV
jgi:hypothetical protein